MKNKKEIKKIHFIGIKGVGMAALAILAKEMGYQVTGSDSQEKFVTDEMLAKAGISVFPFEVKNLKNKPDVVVVSAAYGKENLEFKEARKKRLEVKPYSEFLAMLASDAKMIAVAGVHGKTTTTALISFLLTKANMDPSFVIGSGKIPSLDASAHFGQGDLFILEADEYRKGPDDNDSKFFDFYPQIEVITSIEMDHPDVFLSKEKIYDAFYKFACRVPRSGFIVLCADYSSSKKLLRSLADRNFETYGFGSGASWQIIDFIQNSSFTIFTLLKGNKKIGPFKIKIPGKANALNATAAIIVAIKLGVKEKIIKKYLLDFSGVKRRFEKVGQKDDIIIIDDYAHHPRSVALTLESAKKMFPDSEIWCIFQPHTYSRTKEFLNEFSKSFSFADRVIITEIFSSAREKEKIISGRDLAAAIRENQNKVKFITKEDNIVQEIIDNVKSPAIILTIGAGDVYKLGDRILAKLKEEKNHEK